MDRTRRFARVANPRAPIKLNTKAFVDRLPYKIGFLRWGVWQNGGSEWFDWDIVVSEHWFKWRAERAAKKINTAHLSGRA